MNPTNIIFSIKSLINSINGPCKMRCKKKVEEGAFRVIKSEKDVVIFSYAAYKATDGKASFGYVAMIKGVIVDAGDWNGPKVTSSKEAKARAVLAAIKRAIEKGFTWVHVLLNAKEVV